MKTIDKKALLCKAVPIVLLLFACFYMYDFYKCLSGFIANGFREPLVMLPIILAFFLPVFCFLFFFYDYYVARINHIVKTVYSIFVILYAIVNLALIFSEIELYVSNNALGVYSALPSVIIHYPYDMIAVHFLLIAWQIMNLVAFESKGNRIAEFLNRVKQRGALSIGVIEYIILSVFAIVVFVFTGSAIYAAFSAFSNAFYDFRYIYLLLWVMIIPMGNLAVVTVKPEKMSISKRSKLIILGSGIAANLMFGAVFLLFELTTPDFLIHIGKPLFLITFSVSLPIEPCIIFGIMALGTLIMTLRLILTAIKKARQE